MVIGEYSANEGECATLHIVFAHLFSSGVACRREPRWHVRNHVIHNLCV